MMKRMLILLMALLLAAPAGLAANLVHCDYCGGWYEEGNIYRNHYCPLRDQAQEQEREEEMVGIALLYVNTANGLGLNMREGPSTQDKVVTVLPNGCSVTVFRYEGSSWAYVAYRSYFGYVMTRHLSEYQPGSVKPSVQPTVTPAGQKEDLTALFKNFMPANYTAAVKPVNPTGFVNLRWAPSLKAPVMSIHYGDEQVEVLNSNGVWSQVRCINDNSVGFMMNEYMRRIYY